MAAQLDGLSAHAIECKIPGTNIEMFLDLPRSRGAWFCESKTGDDYLDLTGLFGGRALGFNHRGFIEHHKTPPANQPGTCPTLLEQLHRRMMKSKMAEGFAGLELVDSAESAMAYALDIAYARRGALSQVIHFSGNREHRHRDGSAHSVDLACPSLPATQSAYESDLTAEEQSVLDSLSQAVDASEGGIAAVVVESVQSSLGDHYLRPDFLKALQELCRQSKSLLIVDEVDSGFGRSGSWWDCQHLGVKPDMIVFGGIAELGGVLIAEDLMGWVGQPPKLPEQGQLNRCNAVLDAMENEKLIGHAGLMGRYLDTVLTELVMKYSALSNPRARGLRGAFDLPSADERDALIEACLKEYLILLPSGVRSVSLRPTLDVRPDAIGRGIAQLEAALKRVYG
jgi:L-lysine 6-transaminase